MKYLVLRQFSSYGRLHKKGTIVDESEIRHVRIRLNEKLITPAVSSLEVPVEMEAEDSAPPEVQQDKPIEETPVVIQEPAPKKPLLSFGK